MGEAHAYLACIEAHAYLAYLTWERLMSHACLMHGTWERLKQCFDMGHGRGSCIFFHRTWDWKSWCALFQLAQTNSPWNLYLCSKEDTWSPTIGFSFATIPPHPIMSAVFNTSLYIPRPVKFHTTCTLMTLLCKLLAVSCLNSKISCHCTSTNYECHCSNHSFINSYLRNRSAHKQRHWYCIIVHCHHICRCRCGPCKKRWITTNTPRFYGKTTLVCHLVGVPVIASELLPRNYLANRNGWRH